MKKLVAIGIIFLFISVAVAPSINSTVVKVSDDLVEVTSQACGIQGFGNTTVKLTRQQYQNLEQYLVEFRAKLNQTTTRDKAVPIFKDAVVELNKYGLLPRGMSIEQAQKLISGPQLSSNQIEHLKGLLKNTRIGRLMDVHNLFCFVYAYTTFGINVNIVSIVGSLLFVIGLLLFLSGDLFYVKLIDDLSQILTYLGGVLVYYGLLKPFIPLNIFVDMENANYSSIGMLGKVQGSDTIALLGFTGFNIIIGPNRYYLGWTIDLYS